MLNALLKELLSYTERERKGKEGETERRLNQYSVVDCIYYYKIIKKKSCVRIVNLTHAEQEYRNSLSLLHSAQLNANHTLKLTGHQRCRFSLQWTELVTYGFLPSLSSDYAKLCKLTAGG